MLDMSGEVIIGHGVLMVDMRWKVQNRSRRIRYITIMKF